MSSQLLDRQLQTIDSISKLEREIDTLLKGLTKWLSRLEDTQVILVN